MKLTESKVCIFEYLTDSTWMSCSHINRGLRGFYMSVYKPFEPILIAVSTQHFGFLDAIEKIIKYKPKKLVFYDHRLNPSFILSSLKSSEYPMEELEIIFHLYGNPAEKLNWWLKAYNASPQSKWQFITSCESSKVIFESFFKIPPSVLVMPFPCDEYRESTTNEEFEYLNSQNCIIYSGRISPDKNVHLLIPFVAKLRKSDPSLSLILVGPFDDLHNFSIDDNKHSYQLIISNQIKKYDPDGEFIYYYSKMSSERLDKLYKKSNYMISLSTLFGEDFGMSIVEAAKNGLCVYLTKWAGYKDHAKHLHGLNYIDVIVDKSDLTISLPDKLKPTSKMIKSKNIELNSFIYSQKYCEGIFKEFFSNKKVKLDLIKISITLSRNVKTMNSEFIKEYNVLW